MAVLVDQLPFTDARPSSARYPLILLAIFAVIWTALAIEPWYREDWLLENWLVFATVPTLVLTYRNLRFSNFSYTLICVFLIFHEIGAHYTYAEVPYDQWFQSLTGRTLNGLLGFERNHYDRLIHFAYGLMLVPPTLELLRAKGAAGTGIWRFIVPLFFLHCQAGLFEMMEWVAAELFGGELGQAYLGTQGDVWDAHKDMALAGLGTIIGLTLVFLWPRPRHPRRPR
jgi:putative membrane protein